MFAFDFNMQLTCLNLSNISIFAIPNETKRNAI